jgi:hypothetical protein
VNVGLPDKNRQFQPCLGSAFHNRWLAGGFRCRRKKQQLHFLTLRQCARRNGEELFVGQLRDWDITAINHSCVEISVLVFFPLNPQTGEFGFRNDRCDGGRMIAVGRGRALDVIGLANETFKPLIRVAGRLVLVGLRPSTRPVLRVFAALFLPPVRDGRAISAPRVRKPILSGQIAILEGRSSRTLPTSQADVRFSNRPFGVKRFQTFHHCSVDVAHRLASLRNRHQGPSIMGFEDEVEQSKWRPCQIGSVPCPTVQQSGKCRE